MAQKLILWILLLCNCSAIFGYKILMVCPPPAKSHHNLCKGIVDILGDAGHKVTFISAFQSDNSKHREIVVPELHDVKDNSLSMFSMANVSKIETIKFMTAWQPRIAEKLFNNAGVKKLLSDPQEKFDLAIYEYFMNEYLLGFSVHFKCPSIMLSPVPLMSWLATMTGNPQSIAIVPNVFTQFTPNMNLWQRTINTFVAIIQDIMATFLLNPINKDIYTQYFPKASEEVPYEKLKNLVSLILVNSHPIISPARPLLPNIIEIGGYHIREPETLPEDLQQILDNSKHGVIFFSMGSNLKSSLMSSELKRDILKTIASLKETVLWKFEVDLPDKPTNLIIRKWLPQTGILAHPNVKLFISHGGLLSCIEATYFGKPLLILPVYGDQHHNAVGMEEKGQGLFVQFDNITETSLRWGLNELLNNKKFSQNAKRIQKIFHDRPTKVADLVNFYVKHVIETEGAWHLSPPRLPRYSHMLLDVAAVVLIPLVLVAYILNRCCKKICRTKSKVQMKKKNE